MKSCATAALMLVLATAACAQAPVAAVRVANPSDRARQAEPVSVGFPLPEAPSATDAKLLALADAEGHAVPCQFKVLSRWRAPRETETAPLKWVLATFETDAAPKSVAAFHIAYGAAPPKSDAGCAVSVEADAIRVRTSPTIAFSVPKKTFAPLRSATLGDPAVELVPSEGSVLMTYADGSPRQAVVTRETAVEEAGPIRVILVQKGEIAELRYTCRWTFHAGRADVAVEFRLENPRAYGVFDKAIEGGQVYFKSLELAQPIAGATGSYELTQTWAAGGPNDMLAGFSFTETENGAKVRSGRRHSGAVDCAGPNGGATVAVAGFWQNYPKAIRKADASIMVDLFPAFGHGPEFRGQYASSAAQDKNPVEPMALQNYRFEGGRWKSHRVIYDFHAAPRDGAEVDAIAANIDTPLVGCPEPSSVRKSGVLGPLWVERGLLPSEPGIDRFERFLDIMVDDGAADPSGRNGRIGLPKFLDRGGPNGNRQPYGWDNFGDIPWGDGWCNLHYDWPGSILSGFLRTGDPRLFFRGRDMAVFRRDYGQNHSQDPREGWRGAAFYEKGWWHGNYIPGAPSHNWLLGLALHYAITGDEWTREAIVENCDYTLRHPPGMWSGWWGSRIPGWQIECLVDAWGVIGDPKYLEHAAFGVARFEELETLQGATGYFLTPQNKSCRVWMDNIFFAAAAKYVFASGDTRPLNFLAREKNWFKRECIVPPQGSPASMYLAYIYEDWSPTKVAGPSIHHIWAMTNCLSMSAYLFDDADDRMWANILFETAVRYWQEKPGKARSLLSPAGWSPITMRPLTYPNSESKVLGDVLLWGASHLGMRAHADGLY